MANLPAKDGSGASIFIKATGAGTNADPFSTESKTNVLNFPATQAVTDLNIGNTSDTPATSDTGTFSLISLIKRLLGKIPTLVSGRFPVDGSGVTQPISVSSNATLIDIGFTNSTTSSAFVIANRLALIVVPAITNTPTITLQVSLDNGITWVDSSVSIVANATIPQLIEADALAKLSGGIGLANAFRFKSNTTIGSATFQVRSIVQ